MNRLAQVTFAVLVCATFGAFFVAQGLKSTPPLVQDIGVTPRFSPNRDGRHDRAVVSFRLKHSDEIAATVVDHHGDDVRRLVTSREISAKQLVRLKWDGLSDSGTMVPDGTYRVRLNLRRQARALTLPRNIIKDTKPPVVRVTSIGPQKDKVPRPELLPRTDGRPIVVHFVAPGTDRQVLVYRTDVVPAQGVRNDPLPPGATQWTWNGTVDGRHVAAGTYLIAVRARDGAGNIGTSVTPLPPRPTYGQAFPGRGGVTVRYVTAQGSARPVQARHEAVVAVDSVGKRFRWTLRRAGSPEVRSHGRGSGSKEVRFQAPGGVSGLYVFEARTRTHRTAAPVLVQSPRHRPVLVVLPATTWQGRNRVDDDGDGRPDTLEAGLPVRLDRPYAQGLPPQIARHEALLLAELDRGHHAYDITTDIALARGQGPSLAGHRGVLLAGDTRWLAPAVARALRSFVRGGGTLVSLGVGSLLRSVTFTPRGRAIDPTPPTSRDLFGERLGAIVRRPVTLMGSLDHIGLFSGTVGLFGGVTAVEPTVSVQAPARIVAAATTPGGARTVVVAVRFGRGLVIRPGLPDFAARLRGDGELAALTERMWALLAGGR